MAYTGDWISELEPTNPLGSESKAFGDDAIREIKRALQNAFPNTVTGDSYDGTLSQLTDLAAGQTLPFNTVIMWSGLEGDTPPGWTICDGRSRPGGGVAPDLRGRFIIGAAVESEPIFVNVGEVGGSGNIEFTGQVTNGHALLAQELPTHTHGMFANASSTEHQHPTTGLLAVKGDSISQYYIATENGGTQTGRTYSTGADTPHTHDFSVNTAGVTTGANLPPYYGLLYLIKD